MPYRDPEVQKAYMKAYDKARNANPEWRAYKKAYNKAYNATPEVKAYMKAYMKVYRLRKKDHLRGEKSPQTHDRVDPMPHPPMSWTE